MASRALAAAVCVAAWTRGYGWSCDDAGATTELELFSLADVDPLAVCNDLTPAAARARALPPPGGREKTKTPLTPVPS